MIYLKPSTGVVESSKSDKSNNSMELADSSEGGASGAFEGVPVLGF
jgi:hypothetical protein